MPKVLLSEVKFVKPAAVTDQIELAKEALDAELYEREEWQLMEELNHIRIGYWDEDSFDILVARNQEGEPIAISLRLYRHLMFYVKPEYRRNGIATKMAEMWKNFESDVDFYVEPGIPESRDFFNKVELRCIR